VKPPSLLPWRKLRRSNISIGILLTGMWNFSTNIILRATFLYCDHFAHTAWVQITYDSLSNITKSFVLCASLTCEQLLVPNVYKEILLPEYKFNWHFSLRSCSLHFWFCSYDFDSLQLVDILCCEVPCWVQIFFLLPNFWYHMSMISQLYRSQLCFWFVRVPLFNIPLPLFTLSKDARLVRMFEFNV